MSNLVLFESKNIRRVWNEETQRWFFSVPHPGPNRLNAGWQRLVMSDWKKSKIRKLHQSFPENEKAAVMGGTVAGNARRELEKRSGRKVSTKENYKQLTEIKRGSVKHTEK